MLNEISQVLYAGLAISSGLASIQDFKSEAIHHATWIPAAFAVLGYLYLVNSVQFVAIEFVWFAIVFGVAIYLFHKKTFSGGDVAAVSLISFAPVALLITACISMSLSFKFKNPKTGYVPFVGVLGVAFVVFTIVVFLAPFWFL